MSDTSSVDQFPLTFRLQGREGDWEAFCPEPEWGIGASGETKEEAKQVLCQLLLINAREILRVKDIHPDLTPAMIATAQTVVDNESRLSELLRESTASVEMIVTLIPHDGKKVEAFDLCRAVRVLTAVIMRGFSPGEAEYKQVEDSSGPGTGRVFTVRWSFRGAT